MKLYIFLVISNIVVCKHTHYSLSLVNIDFWKFIYKKAEISARTQKTSLLWLAKVYLNFIELQSWSFDAILCSRKYRIEIIYFPRDFECCSMQAYSLFSLTRQYRLNTNIFVGLCRGFRPYQKCITFWLQKVSCVSKTYIR